MAEKHDPLVMVISHPRECAYGADNDSSDCYRPDDENGIRIDGMVSEVVHNLQDEPSNTGKSTTAVKAS